NRKLYSSLTLATLLATPLGSLADTFFTDNFTHGSTTNKLSIPGGTATASSTSYDLASSKTANTSTIGPNLLRLKLSSSTTSGYWETTAMFTITNPVLLVNPGDYVDAQVVFTNNSGLWAGGNKSFVALGLYDSGSTPAVTNLPV